MSAPNEPEENDENAPKEEEQEEDFAAMLEESLQPTSLQEGDTVEGTIVALGSDVAFVDVGGKGEATIDLEELAEPDGPEGKVSVQVGNTVKAVVVSTSGGIKLSHKLARQAATREALNVSLGAPGRRARRESHQRRLRSSLLRPARVLPHLSNRYALYRRSVGSRGQGLYFPYRRDEA